MQVSYAIHTGTPGEIGVAPHIEGASVDAAIEAFRDFRDEAERFGNAWQDAQLAVDIAARLEPTRLYTFGPRGGVIRAE